MAKLTNWLGDADTKTVEHDSSLVPKVYLSTRPIGAADLSQVTQRELADGWPSEFVTKNSQRRAADYSLFVGDNGYSLGLIPCLDACPKLASSWDVVGLLPGSPRYLYEGGEVSGTTTERSEAKMAVLAKSWSTNNGAADWLVNMVCPGLAVIDIAWVDHTLTYASGPSTTFDKLVSFTSAAASDEVFLAISLDAGKHRGPAAEGPRSVHMVVRCSRNGLLSGIRGLMVTPHYCLSTWINNQMENSSALGITGIVADKGYSRYLALKHPGIEIMTDRDHYPFTTFFFNDSVFNRVFVHEIGTNPTAEVTWWSGPRTLFEQSCQMWSATVKAIGNPEFADRVSFLGSWDAEKPRKLKGTKLVFLWPGKRLVEMQPTMSSEDKVKIEATTVTTVVYDVAPSKEVKLSDTTIYGVYSNAGKDLGPEIYVTADTATERPELTFDQAIAKVSELDTRVWHRLSTTNVEVRRVDRVAISGPANAVLVSSYIGQTLVSTDSTFGLLAYQRGAVLDVTRFEPSLGASDPYVVAWGASSFEIKQAGPAISVKAEMDETTVYGPGAPLIEKLNPSQRVMMMMAQAVINRKTYTSFALGAALMGANARKQLT